MDGASRADAFGFFLQRRAQVIQRRLGDGGLETCHALSDALDEDLEALATASIGSAPAALVAVGGYGRRELCIWSDVDVMLLDGGVDAGRLSQEVFYPLWDAKLRVGHATRTIAECLKAGAESFETLTALLTSRLISGDVSLFADLLESLAQSMRGAPLSSRLAALERERRAADPYPVMTVDLKEGRGALRTFGGFDWERRRASLIGGPSPHEESREEAAAKNGLLAIRNGLHAVAGKQSDEFVYDLRPGVATWLGCTPDEAGVLVCEGTRIGDLLAIRRWPDLTADSSGASGFTRGIFRRRRERPVKADHQTRALDIALGAARRSGGVWFDTAERDAIRDGATLPWTDGDRASFLGLLAAGERGRVVFDLLDDIGWVEMALPEMRHVIAAPQMAPFHEHPVDGHLWRTVDVMNDLVGGGGDGWYADIVREIDDPGVLLLAAFLHDVGKGRQGDHSAVGATVTRELLARLGFAAPVVEAVSLLVAQHLLLADAATRRDLGDPAVIEDIAIAVGDISTLRCLYLLTVADGMATGTTTWGSWKASLVRSLFVRVAARLDPTSAAGDRTGVVDAVVGATGRTADSVMAWIDAMAPDYLLLHDNGEIQVHLDHADAIQAGRELVLDALPEHESIRLIVTTADRTGLLGAIAGVLALRGIEVLDARLATRADGLAVDTFHVRDSVMGRDADDGFWDLVAEDISSVLRGEFDLDGPLAARLREYRATVKQRPVVVRAPMGGAARGRPLEVRCQDQPGVLYEICQELYGAGLAIDVARIDTLGDEVRDTFFVRDISGESLDSVTRMADIVDSVRRGLVRRLM